ncbi:TatD family deoxyribonuclease [Paenibacillus sp. LMG 31461]|uniref:TatD family deoxyribonuclease n=1 Tax=Paenibacillus plantarum TaxID=2654975 RepID=A0ABX1X927_9BACL|nr:TatD family hydrolase [Paenibacillus plantarum]NOU64950.1 TatD family deoxyribonuclease [Paenibacillus plantarum]
MMSAIDAHIHLDMYDEEIAKTIIAELDASQVQALIAVSRHLDSCKATKQLKSLAPDRIFAAYGFHPEQELPTETKLQALIDWMTEHASDMIAVGEIGLPYYTRHEVEEAGKPFDVAPYIQLLERFLQLAAQWDKPVVLHAVYEDAKIVCDLLVKYGLKRAHFHWFKGSDETVERMIAAGYYISITPDVLYEEEIRTLVRNYPLELMMVETDGPWPFEGPFAGEETHPRMIHAVIEQIAELKGKSAQETTVILLQNTYQFYQLS